VVVNYVSGERSANEVVRDIQQAGGAAVAIASDVSDPAQVEQMFAEVARRLGRVRYVVHCAAAGSALKSFGELPWEAFQRQLDVQLRGAYNCLRLALPIMADSGEGAVVLLSSIAADGVPPAQQSDYVVAKAALSALARTLAVENGPRGVRVNLVAPGMTQTDMIAYMPDKAKMLAKMQTPLRRLGEAEDVASAVAFLLSPAARHITGETLRVCGGAVME
jgi:3-oxoacyl-[acyl-carrier protein] reductase